MPKSDITKKLELNIYNATKGKGIFGCFEVTIGFNGNERVDYMTYNTKGIWKFYEIKTSLHDFNSKAQHTFLGHYNYYVVPHELYEKIKDKVPEYIGIYVGSKCMKKSKHIKLGIKEEILKDSMIRSLYRDAEKIHKSSEPTIIEKKETEIRYYKKEMNEYSHKYSELIKKLFKKFGRHWQFEIEEGNDE